MSPCAPAPRCLAIWLAAWLATGALLLLAASPVAVARGPAGGYQETYSGWRASGLGGAWSAALVPLRWLRQSSRSFQSLMRLLAERSVQQAGDDSPVWPRPRPEREEPLVEDEEWPGRSSHGGEARAGRDPGSSAVRVKDWRRWSPSCRRAGVAVPRGGWYVVQGGDTLWSIAEVHYGYGGAYGRILRANPQGVSDPGVIYPCQHIYIPRGHWNGYPPAEAAYEPAPPTHGQTRLDSRAQGGSHGGSNDGDGWR